MGKLCATAGGGLCGVKQCLYKLVDVRSSGDTWGVGRLRPKVRCEIGSTLGVEVLCCKTPRLRAPSFLPSCGH